MSQLKYDTILVNKENQVTTVTLNRPELLNAISPELIDDLYNAMGAIEKDDDTRAIVLTGKGKAFSAGGDLEKDLIPVSKMTPMEWKKYFVYFTSLTQRIYNLKKPVIAAINGVTVGGGCDLAMACDIRIASDKARFGHGYIKMGIIADMGGNYLLPRVIGLGRAKLFAFTGDLIDAREAERIGLIDKLVPADKFEEETAKLVKKIATGPTAAIIFTKEAMRRSLNMSMDDAFEFSVNLQSALLDSEDFKEGYTAFLEKRKPAYKGR